MRDWWRRGDTLKTAFFLILTAFVIACAVPASADIYCFTDGEGTIHFTNVPNDERYKVYLRSERPPEAPSRVHVGEIKRYDPLICAACRRFGVDTDLVRAVIKAESNFNHRAVSPKGALGLMQLMPLTAQEMSVQDPFDPADNIYGGVQYLKRLLAMFKGDVPLALAAYNAGPERVASTNRIPSIEETQYYVQKVLNYFRKYKKNYGYQGNKVL